ncbi:MAG: alpha/beta hydrolase [Cyanobacteria bacterium P01_H01_bin.15]
MATIDVRGVPHAYTYTPVSTSNTATGDSEPITVVFVHGWLLSRHYWEPVVQALSSQWSCLTYDLRGFGDSIPTSSPRQHLGYRLQDYAQDLIALLDQLSIKRAWVVGHSLGGSIALWSARQCPETVVGVIGLNAGGGIYLKEEFERFRQAGSQLVRWRPNWLPQVPLLPWLFSRLMVTQGLDVSWGYQRLQDFVKADSEAALGALLDSTTEPEVHCLPQIVSRLSQPVFFIAGDQDRVMEPKYVRHLASFHPLFHDSGDHNNVVEIANCGHLAMVEHPEEVSAVLRRFLSETLYTAVKAND